MEATLYGIPMSHPVITARLALERKGIPFRERTLLPGAHPLLLAALGFKPTTVPALRIAGRRVQGSLAITRALDELQPTPPLFPPGTAGAAVEEAERWGEQVLQPISRRLIRRTLVVSHDQRRWFAEHAMPLPAPGAVAVVLAPTARIFARMVHADADSTRTDLGTLEQHLEHVDALLDAGVIGTGERNAADCQIAPSVRMLQAFADLREQVLAHPAAAHWAQEMVPDYPEIPSALAAA